MGGEVSLAVAEASLAKLRVDEPESAAALDAALAPDLVDGWRALDVSAPAGCDGVGILSAVCMPLRRLPLLNVSTAEHSFVLVRDEHLEAALASLAAFEVVSA